MKILLLGKNGQVGWELQRSLAVLGQVTALDHDSTGHCGDFARPDAVAATVRALQPDVIVNAAAYTAVDKAESDTELAFRVNAEAVAVLAREAKQLGSLLVHYSTDYVFKGEAERPWREDDETAPLGVYGASKRAGELALAASGAEHLVLRTAWVYAARGSNFLLSMLRLLQSRSELRVVADQIGAPTWSVHLAQASRQLMERCQAGNPGPWGLYQLSASGETSWFGFAAAIADSLRARGLHCARLEPISSAEYPSAAQRPANSRLDCSRLQQAWGVHLPAWQQGLAECLAGHDPNVARQGHG